MTSGRLLPCFCDHSFGRDDLPLVAKLADQGHTFIFERLAEMKMKQSE
jgi:hypothetical protein